MKKFQLHMVIALGGLLNTATALAGLNVVTTTEDIAAIALEIGGDLIEVHSITRGIQDAHFIEAKPSYMVKANRADLLIYQGLSLETGWLPLILRGARNPDILAGKPGHLDLSTEIVPLGIHPGEVDRSMGDIHAEGNPHYPLDPENGILMAEAIALGLGKLDPENSKVYQTHFERFKTKLKTKIKQWQTRLGSLKNREVVTYHTTWLYFLKRFDIETAGTVEKVPGVPPGPRHLNQLRESMIKKNVRVILQANYFETGFSEFLAKETGARYLTLPVSVGGSPDAVDYIALFDVLVSRLAEALSPEEKKGE